jgi:nitrate reductase gamma subunit
MSTFVHVLAYLALLVFFGAVALRALKYLRNPVHLRWELYPVAHEGKGRDVYGGSYLEDVDWWKKPRETSTFGELKVMVPEILFLKAVWEHNRPLWYSTYAFHLGLYLTCAFIALVLGGSIAQVAGSPPEAGALALLFVAIPAILGPVAFALSTLGALLLLHRRITNEDMRTYSSPGHYFNLVLFIIAMGLALASWQTFDPTFAHLRGFLAGLMTFQFGAVDNPLFAAQLIVGFALMAYIPLTHMAHFFMKYFLYHDIRWGDVPNSDGEYSARILTALNYPVTWSAPHVHGNGKSWAEVATFNPTAEPAAEPKPAASKE